MSLREDILDLLPDYVYDVTTDEVNLHGATMTRILVGYHDPVDISWTFELLFEVHEDVKATQVATLIKNYIKYETEATEAWESEGGNGHHRS